MMKLFASVVLASLLSPVVLAQDCVQDTTALASNVEVAASFTRMQAAVIADVNTDFGQFCSVVRLGCNVDFGDYSDSFTSACEAAGGQVLLRDVEFDCKGSINNIQIPVGFIFAARNVPSCIGTTCDVDNLPSAVDTGVDLAVKAAAEAVELAIRASTGRQLECEGELQPGTPTASPPPAAPTSATDDTATTTAPPPVAEPTTAAETPEPTPPTDSTASAPPVNAPVAEPTAMPTSSSSVTAWAGILVSSSVAAGALLLV